jgi:hypothetical protein
LKSSEHNLVLRIEVVDPPAGLTFRLQEGKDRYVPPIRVEDGAVRFELTVRVGSRPDGGPNFLGPFAFGTPTERFVYICSGTYAGHRDSCYGRRAKVPLKGTTWEFIVAALAHPVSVLTASIAGKEKDGGPAAASGPGRRPRD